ncbi:MAG TPA: hypothetical protein VHR37_08985 [Solirubrobacterales bacterium]|nr:hypothetical protein [Solirubrobacterales bacterium]
MLRTLRNVAIIAVLAVPLAFVPGGGNAAQAVLVTLGMAFLATIAAAARQIHRENRLTFDSLPDDQRAVLFGAIGVIVLMIAGAGKLLGGGGIGAVIWVTLVACAVIAIVGVWMRAHTY